MDRENTGRALGGMLNYGLNTCFTQDGDGEPVMSEKNWLVWLATRCREAEDDYYDLLRGRLNAGVAARRWSRALARARADRTQLEATLAFRGKGLGADYVIRLFVDIVAGLNAKPARPYDPFCPGCKADLMLDACACDSA